MFYHGTRADLKPGDLIEPRNATHVYLSPDLYAPIWEWELGGGEGPGRVYVRNATVRIKQDPELANDQSPGLRMSYRSSEPLRVTGEVTEWPLYHGTRADLAPGDLIKPGHTPN